MTNFLIAALFAVLPFTAYAQAIDESPQGSVPQFRSKPVICMNKDEMIANTKLNNMVPLLGALGNSFDGQQSTFEAFFLVHPPHLPIICRRSLIRRSLSGAAQWGRGLHMHLFALASPR